MTPIVTLHPPLRPVRTGRMGRSEAAGGLPRRHTEYDDVGMLVAETRKRLCLQAVSVRQVGARCTTAGRIRPDALAG